VKALKAGKAPDLTQPFGVETEVNLHLPALLPEAYCADIHERLVLYKRFANCESDAEVTELQEELVDRFGNPPDAVRALVASHRLRLLGKPLGMARLDATAESVQIQFEEKPNVDPARIIELVQKQRGWKLAGPTKLRIEAKSATLAERFEAARRALELLSGSRGAGAPAAAARAGAVRAS
jgi:transcription-repair coupling factor (superfamily II helicase)